MDDCHCGRDCFEPIELAGDDMDRIVVVRAPNMPVEQAENVRRNVRKQLRKGGRDYPVVVLAPGFDIETILV